jgi:hypothetical protein
MGRGVVCLHPAPLPSRATCLAYGGKRGVGRVIPSHGASSRSGFFEVGMPPKYRCPTVGIESEATGPSLSNNGPVAGD